MASVHQHHDALERAGYVLVRDAIPESLQTQLAEGLEKSLQERVAHRGRTYAARNLLALPAIRSFAESPPVRELLHSILGDNGFAVRGLLFDKVPGANWQVTWHQDQIIPVAERIEVAGFTAWTVKRGVPHVRPPANVLEKMLILRVHLDDCERDNGALRVLPGSHRHGLLDNNKIDELVSSGEPVVCEASRGDALIMRPLLLHASSPALSPDHRRVVHLDYAAEALPGRLEWPNWT